MVLLPPLVIVGVIVIVIDAENWLEATVFGTGLAAAIVAFICWATGWLSRVAAPCLGVATAVWAYGSLVADGRASYFPLLVVGPLVVSRLPRHRVPAALALALVVVGLGAARLLVTDGDVSTTLVSYIFVPGVVTMITTVLEFPNKQFYDVVTDLEHARDREAQLAVAGERMRFASDLHDIQGHTLHVVKLKAALARRLVATDPEQAEHELQEIHDLVGETITRTKELAHAQRRLNLTAELQNARNLFEAAGIGVDIDEAEQPAPGTGELLGQVLRETTTNILRHAQAEHVRITLSASGITIVNDGAQDAPPVLSGLATLTERIADAGGELTARQQDGRFVTAAQLPAGDPSPDRTGEEEPA